MPYSKKRKLKSHTSGKVLTRLRVLSVLLQNFLSQFVLLAFTDGDDMELINS